MAYEDRLKELGLYSVEKMGFHNSLQKQKGMVINDVSKLFFCDQMGRVRSKWQQGRFRLDSGKNFVSMWVVRNRNRVPRRAVESPTLEVFKYRLDKHLPGVA